MDADNPLQGPRRPLRRGETHALQYDRQPQRYSLAEETSGDEDDGELENSMLGHRTFGHRPIPTEGDADVRFRADTAFRRHVQAEAWAQDDDDDEDDETNADASSLSGADAADEGDATDSEAMAAPYGDLAEDDEDVDVDEEEDGEDGDYEFESQADGPTDEPMISFDPMLLGLKEINNLAHFSVSSHKPGNGVEALLSDDLATYWQSDGPQPHLLTIHFLRRVAIRAIRFYVDYHQDESYTPTAVVLSAGTGPHDLVEFAALALASPVGWQEVDLSRAGGGADGQSLCCWIVQIKVQENHQNGKDTHLRGIKLYALDENAPPADSALDELARIKARTLQALRDDPGAGGDDYLFERLMAQSPDRLPGAPERSGSMATFLRDAEIR